MILWIDEEYPIGPKLPEPVDTPREGPALQRCDYLDSILDAARQDASAVAWRRGDEEQ
jgi:hypothetical protein